MLPFNAMRLRSSGGGGGTDPSFANVVSLLHFDGPDSSTTFTDETGKVWTVVNGGNISTTQSVFGGASGAFAGGGSMQHLTTPDHADWHFGSGDFTLEGRFYASSTGGASVILSKQSSSINGPFLVYRSLGVMYFYSSSDGATWDIASGLLIGNISVNTWYNWSVTRSGINFYTHLDGVAGSTTTSSAALWDSTDLTRIATFHAASLDGWVGYLDEMRVTKGVARYTGSNYTPAAAAFPNS